jgi:hypothetical protein
MVILLAGLLTPVAMADDLTGARAFLCTAAYASECMPNGECAGGPAWNLNIPQFIEVDLDAKTLSTTKASLESRATPIKNLERDGDLIILQGAEHGRAFSFVIHESTGLATIAVAMADEGVVISGACTPN